MDNPSGLEVDARQNGLHSSDVEGEPKYKAIEPDAAGNVNNGAYAYQGPTAERPRKILGLRRTTFTLSTILDIVLILGIVSAIGAGTCASKNGGFPGSSPPPPSADTQQQPTTCPTRTPATNGASPNNNTSTFQPRTSCSTLGSQYASKFTLQQFTLYCETDFLGNDFMGVFVYSFEDCINACASFNWLHESEMRCSHLAYTTNTTAFPESGGKGNCFLKNGTGDGTGDSVISSAVVVAVS